MNRQDSQKLSDFIKTRFKVSNFLEGFPRSKATFYKWVEDGFDLDQTFLVINHCLKMGMDSEDLTTLARVLEDPSEIRAIIGEDMFQNSHNINKRDEIALKMTLKETLDKVDTLKKKNEQLLHKLSKTESELRDSQNKNSFYESFIGQFKIEIKTNESESKSESKISNGEGSEKGHKNEDSSEAIDSE